MNFDRMREVILDKAVRGELVSQLAEDGVVAQIGNTPKEELFQIPKSWKWCSLNMVAQVIAGQSPKGTALTTDSNDTEFHQGKTFFGRQYIQNSGAYTNEPTKIAPKESILLSVRAPVGAVNLTDRKICIGRGLFAIVPNDQLLVKFLYFVLLTKARELQSKSTGTTFKAVTGKVVRDLYVPVPPLKEQARIVDKVSDALEEIDRAEKAYEELQTLAGVLRGQILQEAIQGKLVPQLAEEGVVEQIGVAPDERPFEIPKSWKWRALDEIFKFVDYRGKTPTKTTDGVRLITASNVRQGYVDHKRIEFISSEEYIDRQNRGISKKGDILFTTEAPLGNVALADLDVYSAGQRVITLQTDSENKKLLMYFMLSPYFQKALKNNATGTTAQGIKAARLKKLMLPVPPVEEQARIASKVEELLKQVDALSA